MTLKTTKVTVSKVEQQLVMYNFLSLYYILI